MKARAKLFQGWEDSTMTPFGFTPGNSEDSNEPVDFAAMMEQMQRQIQEQFSKLGINGAGFTGSTEALPKNIVRDTAKKFTTAQGSSPVGANDVAEIEQAFSIAELWLDEATFFPRSPNSGNIALARTDWVDTTLAGWQTSVEPLAVGLSTAIGELLKQASFGEAEATETPSGEQAPMQIPVGMIAALLNSFIGSLIATQLGQAIGGLAGTVTGAHDVGLPLVDSAYPTLVPQNIKEWATDLDIPLDEVRIFQALREAAVARLFAHNPWLVSYIRTAITDYGKGINIDMDAIQEQAQRALESGNGFDPSNPESFTIALNEGIFTPQESPAQRDALTKLETVLALIDGWSEEVVALAAGDRLPNIAALQETLRRRRATSAPTQQLFSSLLGLQVSPRLAREATVFWKQVRELKDVQSRDHIWSGILPTAEDLLNAESFMKSLEIPDDLSGLM
jgi:putative hydrolase